MATEDVLLQDFSIELLGFGVVARETLLVVGDVETTVGSTLKGTEHTRTSRRALKTDIKVTLERPGSILIVERLSHNKGAIRLGLTLILVSKAKLGQGAAGAEETSRVGYRRLLKEIFKCAWYDRTGSPVGETVVDAVAGEFP